MEFENGKQIKIGGFSNQYNQYKLQPEGVRFGVRMQMQEALRKLKKIPKEQIQISEKTEHSEMGTRQVDNKMDQQGSWELTTQTQEQQHIKLTVT